MASSDLVRYSRAGDTFHYRWAARRCLKMIYPNSTLQHIVIEGSAEKKKSGEYVIDVTEYYADSDVINKINYYQLKHTTVQKEDPFTLSDIKSTIRGFAGRYKSLCSDSLYKNRDISFCIVTNRPFAKSLHENLIKIITKKKAGKRFVATLESYTGLSGSQLRYFCKALKLDDSEGDYQYQKDLLTQEVSILTSNPCSTQHMESIAALVQQKALPNSDGKITPQEVLQKFGVTSERDLFPAPSRIDLLDNIILRNVYDDIADEVFSVDKPSIIHAPGGVGKTVCAAYLSRELPNNSVGILYDCFGGGAYRNRSTARHRHQDALVQIINEMAVMDLCDPIIADGNISAANLIRAFKARVDDACSKVQQVNAKAKLVLIIDAADNAELAAEEFSEVCFAHELITENYSDAFKLIMLCRTERIKYVDPEDHAHHIELVGFDLLESTKHIRLFYPNCSDEEALEFHRLTSANPRVQINALSSGYKSVKNLLSSFNANVTNVDNQIYEQLRNAVSAVKRKESRIARESIDNVCVGLASLPPFIPIDVLSKAASVPDAMIKSFIADIGRSLWLVDNYAIQFRDEPTETWFRQNYAARPEQIKGYVHSLRPYAKTNAYISEALPSLYLRADMYEELVRLALSDEELPLGNPTVARNIRVYRLQFALKAALKLGSNDDAIKLALLAGEETAGKTRQLDLLSKNIDLIKPLQSQDEIQSLAYRRVLRGNWDGSENLYAASLLSTDGRLKGEARSFLRATFEWLNIYFDSIKKDEHHFHSLKDEEVSEFAYALNNISGTDEAVSFLCYSFKSAPWISEISSLFIKRLVDSGDNVSINAVLDLDIRNPYFLIGLADELMNVGRFLNTALLFTGLSLLICKRTRITKITHYSGNEDYLNRLISFLEACAKQSMPEKIILRAINIYFDKRASNIIASDIFHKERTAFLRVTALRAKLQNTPVIIDELLPSEWSENKKRNYDGDINNFKSKIESLFPWYQLRVNILLGIEFDFAQECKIIHEKSKKIEHWRYENYDPVPFEIFHVKVSILALCNSFPENEVRNYYDTYLAGTDYARIDDRIAAVRCAYRNTGCLSVASDAEVVVREIIMENQDMDTESKLDNLIMLSRAVYVSSIEDAGAYFSQAVELASRFGDEIVQRWEAVTALAKRAHRPRFHNDNLAYRYFRCAELVGENVAREKYWDRNEAVITCVNLSPATAIASLSRWRDREVGRFYLQIHALAYELVLNDHVSPMEVWCLTGFYEDHYYYAKFAALCIDKEKNLSNKQILLDSAVYRMQIAECDKSEWLLLKECADRNKLANRHLDYLIDYHSIENKKVQDDNSAYQHSDDVSLDAIFDGVDLLTQSGINEIYRRLKSDERYTVRGFLNELFLRLPKQNIIAFLLLFLESEYVDIYDAIDIMSKVKNDFGNKISFQREWGNCLYKFGYCFPYSLVSYRSFGYYTEKIVRDEEDIKTIKNAILKGFTDHASFTTAEICFGFIINIVDFIQEEHAEVLLDYALTRFEKYIDEDFGDGSYKDNKLASESVSDAIAGFIWSALGSPHSSTRWRAANAVKLLASSSGQNILDSLMMWMQSGEVGAYGYSGYPFYRMHAELYLLIALLRVAVDDASVIYKHRQQIEEFTSEAKPHILMQKISADICLAVGGQFQGTYPTQTIECFENIAKSPFSLIPRSNGTINNSYLRDAKLIDVPEGYYHGCFFKEDWFKPLGNVFNISDEQVEDLATDVVINDWAYPLDDEYVSDPRRFQWQHGNLTHHSHGSYPRSDDYKFYLSYHAMLSVASKLLKNMPVIQRYEDEEDPWGYWFSWHRLTRDDGKWVSDRRDPPPLYRNDFYSAKSSWETSLNDDVFYDGLVNKEQDSSYFTVYGWWEDGNSSLRETYHVSSAFIAVETTNAIVNALNSFDSCHDYRLPNYQEDTNEDDVIVDEEFNMQGWIVDPDSSKKIDEYDPFAADISYPPYEIGYIFAELMGVAPDSELRFWHDKDTNEVKAMTEIWCSDVENPMKDLPLRKGMRISVKYDSLLKLCNDLDRNLLLEVTVKRTIKQEHYSYEKSREYKLPEARLFVVCKDGVIRQSSSARKNDIQRTE